MLKYKNKYCSLTMERRGRILLCTHHGTINGSLMAFFNDHFEEVLGDLKGCQWCYLSNAENASIGTREMESMLVDTGFLGLRWGCVGAAYVLKSPVLIAQTQRVRDAMGISQPLEDVIFDTQDKAIQYLTELLASNS